MFETRETKVTSFVHGDDKNPYLVTERHDHEGDSTYFTYTDEGNLETVRQGFDDATTRYVYAQDLEDENDLNDLHRHLVREIHRPTVKVNGIATDYPPTTFEYDEMGNLASVTNVRDGVAEVVEMHYSAGLLDWMEDQLNRRTEFKYHPTTRNLMEIWVPSGPEGSTSVRKTYFQYDAYDNLESVQVEGLPPITTVFDLNGRPETITDARIKNMSYVYTDGALTQVTLPSSNGSSVPRKTTMTYDSGGRLQSVYRDISSSAQELRVSYDYDGVSRLTDLIRLKNGVPKSFRTTYDALNRPKTSRDYLGNVSSIEWESSCSGRTEISARGMGRKYGVDPLCRTTTLELGDSNPLSPSNLSSVREERSFDYDELGRLISTKQEIVVPSLYGEAVFGIDSYGNQPVEERFYEYDELNQLEKLRIRTDGDPLGANDKSIFYKYDAVGKVTEIMDPLGKVTKYQYLRDNKLAKIILERSGVNVGEFTYTYDTVGRLASITYPSGVVAKFLDNASTPDSGWDANGNLLYLRYETTEGQLIRRFEYTYDDSNNRQSMLDVDRVRAVKWEYGYDWLDRLVSVKMAREEDVLDIPTSLPLSDLQREYVYDESDNRIFLDDHDNQVTYHYRYKSFDDAGTTRFSDELEAVLVSTLGDRNVSNFSNVATFTHDADGNMTSRISSTGEVLTYIWDDADRLVRVKSTGGNTTGTLAENNRYDVNGIRKLKLAKNGNSSTEYTAGISTVASEAATSSSASPTISYITGPMILGAEVNGNFQFFLTDALGTVRDVVAYNSTTEEWEVVQSYEFNEHGLPMTGSGAGSGTFSPKTYQGALSVNDDRNDSGLYLMGHRHYAADLGRFISRDPIGFAGGLNLYNGHGVSPVMMTDQTGLAPMHKIQIGLDPAQLNDLNCAMGTSITPEDIASSLQSRLRHSTPLANIKVQAINGQWGTGQKGKNETTGLARVNLDVVDYFFNKAEPAKSPWGFTDFYKARVSLPSFIFYAEGDIARKNSCSKENVNRQWVENFIMNIILHELAHAIGAPAEATMTTQGGLQQPPFTPPGSALMMPQADPGAFSKVVENFDSLSLSRMASWLGY